MVDLNAKIADARRKAVAWRDAKAANPDYTWVWVDWRNAMSADLIIAWAEERDRDKARIEELENVLKPFALAASAYDKCKPTRPMRFVWEFDKTLEVGHLLAASRALNGEKQ